MEIGCLAKIVRLQKDSTKKNLAIEDAPIRIIPDRFAILNA